MKRLTISLMLVLICAAAAHAQGTGQIFGRATDTTGAILPGVIVTLTAPVLLQPLVAVTSETGTYQFPRLTSATYVVRFDLPGFTSFVREQIRIETGFNAQINAELDIADVEETVTVTGLSPVVDVRSTTQGTTFSIEDLNEIPTIRDPFSILAQAPGLAMNSQNVGGNLSGRQANFIMRAADKSQSQWFVDGVDIVSGGGGNGTPYYPNYDSWEEMQVSTGGADVETQSPGVRVNMITKSGGDSFRGVVRASIIDQRFVTTNIPADLRLQNASAGNMIQRLRAVSGDFGGPIAQGRAWFWGAMRRDNIKKGVETFLNTDGGCAPIAADPLSFPLGEVRKCMNSTFTDMYHLIGKVSVAPFRNNKLTFTNAYDLKRERPRSFDSLTTLEATTRLGPVNDRSFGANGWRTGWPATVRVDDQHIFSDRLLLDVSVAHYHRSLEIALHDPALRDVQPMREITSKHRARSRNGTVSVSPSNHLNVTAVYFVPGRLGGDHSFKANYTFRGFENVGLSFTGGDATAFFDSPVGQPRFSTPFAAEFNRPSFRDRFKRQQSVYFQDVYTRDRWTASLGVRWDRQDDWQNASTTPASAFDGQTTADGSVFNFLPAVDFPGAKSGVVWNFVAPRLGLTYDLFGDGQTVFKASYAVYNDRGLRLSDLINPIASSTIRFPWNDANGDTVVQANEVDTTTILKFTGYDPFNPTSFVSANRIDPNVKVPRTNEIVVGIGRELAPDLGINVSYIWRRYDRFTWTPIEGISSANYSPVTFTPPASDCPADARCEAVTYYVPDVPLPAGRIRTNRPDFSRSYQGVEGVVSKRMSDRWMMNASLAYNDQREQYDSAAAYQDPTNIDQLNDGQYAPETGGSGISDIFMNTRWIFKANGLYVLPYEISLAAAYEARQGFPYIPTMNISSRPNRAGGVEVLLDTVGDVRLGNFQNLDLRVSKTFTMGTVTVQPSLDIFNVPNWNTVFSRRRNQNSSVANDVSTLLAPAAARFGVTVTF